MSNVVRLPRRRTREYYGKIIPSSMQTVIEPCPGDDEDPHVHLIGFADRTDRTAEYEMVLGKDIIRHILEVFIEQGGKL